MSIEGQGHFFTIYFPGFVCFVLYLAKISGERLQDHWSSRFNLLIINLPTIVDIVTFMSRINFMLSFINSGSVIVPRVKSNKCVIYRVGCTPRGTKVHIHHFKDKNTLNTMHNVVRL